MASAVLFGPVAEDLSKVEEAISQVARVEQVALATLLEHILDQRGKRLRPALVLLAAGFAEYPIDRLVKLGTAIELLHTATLIHDDLVDGAETRRGVATLHSLVDERTAVLVGDYIFAKAAALCAQTGSVRVVGIFGETLMRIVDGELRQSLSAGNWRQSVDDYYRKISSKTASLFRTATETGAILSEAPEAYVDALREYGLNLGLAFQIVDDVLDFVGDERVMGKPAGSDLRQGTITLPALWFLENRPGERLLRDALESDGRDDGVVREAVKAVVDSPAIDYTMSVAHGFVGRARDAATTLPDSPHRRTLLDLLDYVVDRAR